MNKLRPVALLCGGPVSRSPLTRIPNLQRHLAWVKSSSFRIASRAVNALGAGNPVSQIAEMKRAGTWMVSVPSGELPAALEELREAGVDWRRRVLLIFDSEVESNAADYFRQAGAFVATFTPVDEDESRYIVEGDSEAVRVLRALIEDKRARRITEIEKGAKAKYLAGAQAATKLLLPLIAKAVQGFQSAGIGPAESKAITEVLVTSAMRSYFRAGQRALK